MSLPKLELRWKTSLARCGEPNQPLHHQAVLGFFSDIGPSFTLMDVQVAQVPGKPAVATFGQHRVVLSEATAGAQGCQAELQAEVLAHVRRLLQEGIDLLDQKPPLSEVPLEPSVISPSVHMLDEALGAKVHVQRLPSGGYVAQIEGDTWKTQGASLQAVRRGILTAISLWMAANPGKKHRIPGLTDDKIQYLLRVFA